MQRIEVVIGIVLRNGTLLISQRPDQGPLGGLWEFPGGKLEPGESIEHCLARELLEELAVQVSVLEPLPIVEHDYPAVHVRLHPYLCQHLCGEPQPLASQQVRWVRPDDLVKYHFPPANDALIRCLLERFGATPAGPLRNCEIGGD